MTSTSGPLPAPRLNEDGQRRLEGLAAKGWVLAEGHPLTALQGRQIGPFRLVVLLGPKNNVGSRYFQLFLADEEGRLSGGRLALGLFNSGPYPAFNWAELTHYEPACVIDGLTVDIAAEGYDLALFQMLSALIPSGGHLMVEYDSPSQEATARVLTLGYPPVTSPIGYRLFQVGVRSYRDWYISEGGREGPRKLQGFKPLNEEIEQAKTAVLLKEVEAVLGAPSQHGEWGEIARRNAASIAEALGARRSLP